MGRWLKRRYRNTVPSMQVTDAPPTQTWPAASREVHAPFATRQLPWLAMYWWAPGLRPSTTGPGWR